MKLKLELWLLLVSSLSILNLKCVTSLSAFLLDSNNATQKFLVYGPNPFRPESASPYQTASQQFGNFTKDLISALGLKLNVSQTFISFASLWATRPALNNNYTALAVDNLGTAFVLANPAKSRKWTWNINGEPIAYSAFANDTEEVLVCQALARNLPLWEEDSLWNRSSTLRAWVNAPSLVPICGSLNGTTAEILYLHCPYGQDPLYCGAGLIGTYKLRFLYDYSDAATAGAFLSSSVASWDPVFNSTVKIGDSSAAPFSYYVQALYWEFAYLQYLVGKNATTVISSELPDGISYSELIEELEQLKGEFLNPDVDPGKGGDSDTIVPSYPRTDNGDSEQSLDLKVAKYYYSLLPLCPVAEGIPDSSTDNSGLRDGLRSAWMGAICFVLFVGATMSWAYNNALLDRIQSEAQARLKELESRDSTSDPLLKASDRQTLYAVPTISTEPKRIKQATLEPASTSQEFPKPESGFNDGNFEETSDSDLLEFRVGDDQQRLI